MVFVYHVRGEDKAFGLNGAILSRWSMLSICLITALFKKVMFD